MEQRAITPLGAVVRGMLAGAVGSLAESVFFRATASVAPATPPDAFQPPEPGQRDEVATQTVARRWGEQFMQRGPLTPEQRKRAGNLVHYAFGAAWGMDWAILRESVPALASPGGAVAFGTAAWLASDNVILPAFQLSGPPTAYPAKNHAYAWAAHAVYGLAVWGAYEALRRSPAAAIGVLLAGTSVGRRRTVRGRAAMAIEPLRRRLARAA
jgi:uncharacterized membrane protein YagU involved in acid resistance